MYRKDPIKATNRSFSHNEACKNEVFEKVGTPGKGGTPWLSTFYKHIDGGAKTLATELQATKPKRTLQLCQCGRPVSLYRSLADLFDGNTVGKTVNKLCPHCLGKKANQRAREK